MAQQLRNYRSVYFGIGIIALLIVAVWLILRMVRIERAVYLKPLSDAIQTLNPAATRGRTDYMVGRAIFGQMLTLNEFGTIQDAFIEKWEVGDSGQHYTFRVREDVSFHDNILATVDDAIFSIHYLAGPDSLVSNLFQSIEGFDDFSQNKSPRLKGVTKIDEHTFQVVLAHPSYVFLSNLADPKVVLLPNNLRGLSPEVFFSQPIGIGPYSVEGKLNGQKRLTLKANPTYYRGKPRLNSVVLETMTHAEAMDKFIRGEVHDLESFPLSAKDVDRLKDIANIYSTSSYSTGILFFNGTDPFFKSKKTRQAFRWAVNVVEMARVCSLSVLPSTGIFPQGMMGWVENPVAPNLIQEQPKRKSTVSSDRPLRMLVYGEEYPACVLENLANQLETAVGRRVEIMKVSASEAIDIFYKRKYDLFFEHISVRGREPFHILSFFDPRSPHNLTGFSDHVVSDMVNQIRTSSIRNQRAVEYLKLNQYISNQEALVVPLFTDIRQFAFNKKVGSKSVPATIQGFLGFEDVWLE